MQKHVFIVILMLTALVLYAQTDSKSAQQTPTRTKVKEGVKMYELKMDDHSGVVIVDPKSDKKEEKQHNSVVPAEKDTARGKR